VDVAHTRRLILVELLIFISLAGITALLFRPLMGLINKNVGIVQSGLISSLEKAINRPIRYSSMSPSLIGSMEIRDITIGDEPEPLARLDYVRLDYSLWDLIRGKGIAAIRDLVLDKPEISYHAERDQDLAGRFSSGGKTAEKKPLALPPNCHAALQNGKLLVTKGALSFGVDGIFLEGEIYKKVISLKGIWNTFLDPGEVVSMRGSVRGEVSDSFKDGKILLSVDSVEGSGFEVGKLAFSLSFFEDRIVFERDQDALPLRLSAVYSHERKEIAARFFVGRFLPESMIRFSGSKKIFDPLLALSLSGEASLLAAFSRDYGNTVDYRFNLTAEHSGSGAGRNVPVKNFALAGEGNDERVVFSCFTVEANHGSARYDGDILFKPFLPEGEMVFSAFSITGDSDVNGSLVFSRTGRGVNVHASRLSFGETLLTSLAGDLFFDDGGGNYTLKFDQLGKSGASFWSWGSFTTPGQLESTLTLRNCYASDLLNLARPFVTVGSLGRSSIVQTTALSTELSFRTDFSSLLFRTGHFLINYRGRPFLSASIEGSEKYISISEGQLWLQQNRARFGFTADYSNLRDLNFNCTVGYLDLSYAFTGRFQNGNSLTLQGPNDFLLAVQEREQEGWAGSVRASYFPIPYQGRRVFLSLDSALSYRNSAFWNLNLNRFEIHINRNIFEQSELSVRGTANQNGFNLDRIYYVDQGGPLEGSAAAVWNNDLSFIDGSFVLNDPRETETLSGDFFYESGKLKFHGTASAFKLDRVVESGRNLRLSGELSGDFSGEGDYSATLSLDSLTGGSGERSFYCSASAFIDPEQFVVSQIKLSASDITAEISRLSVDLGAGRLETEVQAGGSVNNHQLGTAVSLGVNFTPVETWLDLEEALHSLSGILDVQYAYMDNKETEKPFSFVFSRITPVDEAALIRVSGGPGDMLNLEYREYTSGGVFNLSLSNPSPVQGAITGTLDGTYIDALATEVFIDMGGLWDIIPVSDVFRFTGGFISGETRIFGSIFDPEFAGSAWGSGIALAVPQYVPAEIGPGSGNVTLEGSEISFGPVAAPCGEGSGIINGWVRYNSWIPSFFLDIEVDKSIPFDFNLSGLMARGNATGILNIEMENNEVMTITGRVNATDTEITLDSAEVERASSEAGLSRDMEIVADVLINTGRRMEFLWPNTSTPLLRAYGETDSGVRITGDTRIPHIGVDGDITLRGGELYHFQRSFYIREGLLRFNGNDPQIDPRMSARAEIRDQNDDGPVTITMVVDNIPLSILLTSVSRFESTPSLSQLEIYSILGQAPSAGFDENQPLERLIGSTMDMILQTVIFRGTEQRVRNVLGLDMFSFRTQIVQNAVFESIRDRDPDEQSATMGNYLDNTAVFMGKYIGRDLFAQTMVSFQYNQYQTEYWRMLEMDIGLDLHTPLFDIRWNISPQPKHFENLFVSDQSISLMWRWSL